MQLTLTIHIHRRGKEQAGYGTLGAFVVQGRQRGSDLLAGRSITRVETARAEALRRLTRDGPLVADRLKVIWTGEPTAAEMAAQSDAAEPEESHA
jgi:hypothetical protein